MEIHFTNIKSRNCGMLLIDVIIALALSAIFVTILSNTSSESRVLFNRAKDKQSTISSFSADGFNASTSISSYGNDLLQNNLYSFSEIVANDTEHRGTPLCSVDFMKKNHSINIIPISLPINPLLPMTDFEIRNGIAYISIDSSVSSDPDMIIMNIRNTTNPVLLSSINTGPGISAMALADDKIYAAANSTASQLHIIRLHASTDGLPTSLTLEKKYKLPLPLASSTPPHGTSIFFNNANVYLGTDKWEGDELSVVDVSDPINPEKVGGYEVDSKVKDIYVRDGTAYIAGSNENQLLSLDVSDVRNPTMVSKLTPSGWSRQEGNALSLFEDSVIFGRTSGGFNIVTDHELYIDGATTSLDIPGGVYGIVQDKRHIYLATRSLDKEIEILDKPGYGSAISTSTPTLYQTFSLPVAPQKMTCNGDHIYLLAGSAPVIYEINFI